MGFKYSVFRHMERKKQESVGEFLARVRKQEKPTASAEPVAPPAPAMAAATPAKAPKTKKAVDAPSSDES